MTRVRVLGQAAVAGWADFRTIYTLRSWALGWMARVLAQVAFFAVIGRLLDSPGHTQYLLVGSAVFVAAMETMMAVASTTWERMDGRLPLLVATPSSLAWLFCGRSWFWMASGTVSGTVALLVLAPLFGVALPWPGVVAVPFLIAVVAVGTYGVALTMGGLALRFTELRNVISNVTHLTMMAIGGVLIPTAFWPVPLQTLAAVFPLTHGLLAVRGVLDGQPAGAVLANAGYALLAGACWFVVAALAFRRLVEGARRHGGIEFGA